MSIALASLSVTAGQTYTQNVGTSGTVGAVVILNESPYGLNVSNGSSSQWIAAQTADLVPCNSMGFNGNLTITTDSYLDNASSAPSFLVYFTVFAPGEAIRGTYPAALTRLTNGGNVGTPSNSIEQDMWTPFILSGILPSHTGNTYQTTTGVAFLRQSDNSLLRIAANATSQPVTGVSTTYYHDLNPDGSFSLGTSHSTQPNYLTVATIVTDASGNISTITDTRAMGSTLWNAMQNAAGAQGVTMYNLHVFKDIQADDLLSVQGTLRVTSGSTGTGYTITGPVSGDPRPDCTFKPYNDVINQSSIIFYVNPAGTPPLTAVPALWLGDAVGGNGAQIDSHGVVHASAPLNLLGGNQETGQCGFALYAPDTTNDYGNLVNFKTVMSNTPTSCTFTQAIAPVNIKTGPGASAITKYGFYFYAVANVIGRMAWQGTYVTVGNCLLAVDAAAQTFDHHCDNPDCGHVTTGAPFAALDTYHGAGFVSLSYQCPACGSIEAFTTTLTSADEADMTPQGSGEYATTRGAQATLIRQLMTALGLEVAP